MNVFSCSQENIKFFFFNRLYLLDGIITYTLEYFIFLSNGSRLFDIDNWSKIILNVLLGCKFMCLSNRITSEKSAEIIERTVQCVSMRITKTKIIVQTLIENQFVIPLQTLQCIIQQSLSISIHSYVHGPMLKTIFSTLSLDVLKDFPPA